MLGEMLNRVVKVVRGDRRKIERATRDALSGPGNEQYLDLKSQHQDLDSFYNALEDQINRSLQAPGEVARSNEIVGKDVSYLNRLSNEQLRSIVMDGSIPPASLRMSALEVLKGRRA